MGLVRASRHTRYGHGRRNDEVHDGHNRRFDGRNELTAYQGEFFAVINVPELLESSELNFY